uniref:Histone acetyltransferase type B catalytic subunit n=1 Tax=Daphnia pulex TaxID=6669 RepID=A0A4Y7MW47_DAPPU|nr:EOG090X06NC [Daphnia pulex]SVE84882.1 EOG090X06NC [Daphnia pulex]
MSYEQEEEDHYGPGYEVGSYTKDYNDGPYDGENDLNLNSNPEGKPRILLMGLRRSGKSSIQKVVFHKMSPNETLFLESTNKIVKDEISNSSFVQFQIWDFPGQVDFFDPNFDCEMIFGGCGALVFVIDAQDDYIDALMKLNLTVTRAYKVNPNIRFEVFIHKVDGLSDDHKIEAQRDIHQRANDELMEEGFDSVNLSFYLTSIYDHSSYKKNVLQSFIIDSNEALDFKLVREPSDVDNDETTFKPEMSHQIFGENESIFGYQNLKISLYYTAGKLNTYLGMNYSKKVDPKQFEGATADDVMGAITPKLPPGYMTNLDDFLVTLNKEQSFKPPGELLSTYSINKGTNTTDYKGSAAEKNFELYSCTIEEPSFRSYHERLQTFLLWYVDAASFIDVDDDRWRFYLIFEKYPCDGSHRYALCGYATVYLYFAYPNKTRPRISQFLVLPPFQRVGLGAELLNTIYRSFLKDSNILDITVEDPSEEFTRLRDFVDAQNSKKLSSYSKEKLQQGFNAEMVEDAQRELKINKKQARRVYEILRFEATNLADVEEYRAYRLDVKRRLNIPYQKEASDYKKLQKALNAEELRSTLSTSTKEQRIENLDKQYQMLENEYRHTLERLAATK